MQTFRPAPVPLLVIPLVFLLSAALHAAAPKVHVVTLGATRKVPYIPPNAARFRAVT